MPILRGVSIGKITTPRVTIDPVTGAYTFYVTMGYKPPMTLYATSVAVSTTATSKPTTVSLTPASFGFTTQNQTQTYTATVKDQFGAIMSPQPALTWSSSNSAALPVNASTGVVEAVATGATATITATVTSAPAVTGTATATTPNTIPTTLTINAGYATLEAAAAAGGYKVGFSVNDSYESHSNYAQNYQQMAGTSGICAATEKFHNRWCASVNTSDGVVTTNFSEFYAEWARLQGQGTRIKIPYLVDEGIDASGGIYPGASTYVNSAATAMALLSYFAGALADFWNPLTTGPAAWASGTTYTVGQSVSQSGVNYTSTVSGNVGNSPIAGATTAGNMPFWIPRAAPASASAWNSGSAYIVGNYVTNGGHTYFCWTANTNEAPPNTTYWIQVGNGTTGGLVDVYSVLNEPLLGGAKQGFFSSFLGSVASGTWAACLIQMMYACDLGARLYEINNGHGEAVGDANQIANILIMWDEVIPYLRNSITGGCPTANLGNGYEGHIVCSQCQTTTGTGSAAFSPSTLTNYANDITALGVKFEITEMDVTDDMLSGQNTSAAITQRQQNIGIAYQNFYNTVAAFNTKPDHVILWQLRSPESWLQTAFPRSDGLAQYPNIYLDYNATQAPAWTVVASFLSNGGSTGTITVNDALLHTIPARIADQWGATLSLTSVTWSSSNATYIPVSAAGQFQAKAGSESATITATYAPTSLTATVTVTSTAAALTALAIAPAAATLSAGTLQETATEVDQYGNTWSGGLGGAWDFTSSGSGVTASTLTISSTGNQVWTKYRVQRGILGNLGTWSTAAIWELDGNGTGGHPVLVLSAATNASGQVALTLRGINAAGSLLGGPETPYVAQSALPASPNFIIIYAGWDQTNFKYYIAVADENGNLINDGTNSLSVTQSANYGSLGAGLAYLLVNKMVNGSYVASTTAAIGDGIGVYNDAPPAIAAGLTSTCFAKPTTGDTGFVEGYLMGDGTSGTLMSGGPMSGAIDMTLTGCTGTTADSGAWSGSGSSGTFAWSSDNTAAATVNGSTGLVSFVASGVADIQAVLSTSPTVTGTAIVTCQTLPVATTLTVNPTAVTLADGQTAQIVPTVLDQYGNPFTTATIAYTSSNTAAATVGASTGLITAVATSGSATITTTVTSVTPNLTATTAVTDTASQYTNQPSGMTAEVNLGVMTAIPASGSTVTGGSTFSIFSPSTPSSEGDWTGNLTVVPSAQGTGWRQTYPPSLVGAGNGPCRFGFSLSNTHKTLYIYFKVRFSNNWTNNGNVATKLFYGPQYGNNDNSSNENTFFCGAGPLLNGAATDMWMQLQQQGPVSRDLPAASGNTPPAGDGNMAGSSAGTWHTIELLFTPQSSLSPPTTDGTYSAWMDGLLTEQATNVAWNTTGDVQTFAYLYFNSIYGGGNNSPPNVTPNIFWDLDQLYVSGK